MIENVNTNTTSQDDHASFESRVFDLVYYYNFFFRKIYHAQNRTKNRPEKMKTIWKWRKNKRLVFTVLIVISSRSSGCHLCQLNSVVKMEQSESIVLRIGKIVGLVNCFLSIVAFFHVVILLAIEANEIFTEPAWFIFEIHFVLMFSILWGLSSYWFYSVIVKKVNFYVN